MWDPSARTLRSWAELREQVELLVDGGRPVPPGLFGEMRQIEDRHGLNPKALLQLRWRIVETLPEPDEDAEHGAASGPPSPERAPARRARRDGALSIIRGDADGGSS